MYEYLFLIIIGLIYLVVASISDLRKREVLNWLSFSLIIFGLAYRALYAIFNQDAGFFLYGLLGFSIFFALAYLFYYARVFAGGDAKLLMGLGAVLSIGSGFLDNLILFIIFVLLLFAAGSLWGLGYSLFLALRCKKFPEEFKKQFEDNKILFYSLLGLAVILFLITIFFKLYSLSFFPVIILLFPILYIYAKAVENACMIVEISGKEATIGDWLYEKIKINGKVIKPNWEGLDEKEVELIKKYGKKVKIKQGIPFVPSFLFAFILFLLFKDNLLYFFGLLF